MTSGRQDENAILLATRHTPISKSKSKSIGTNTGTSTGTGIRKAPRPREVAKSVNENANALLLTRRTLLGKSNDRLTKAGPDFAQNNKANATQADDKPKPTVASNRTRTPLTSVPVSRPSARERSTLPLKAASQSPLAGGQETKANTKTKTARPHALRSKIQEPTISSQSRSRVPHTTSTVSSRTKLAASTGARGTKKLNVYTPASSITRNVGPNSSHVAAVSTNSQNTNSKQQSMSHKTAVDNDFEVEYMPPTMLGCTEPAYFPGHLQTPPLDDLDLHLAPNEPSLEPDLKLDLDDVVDLQPTMTTAGVNNYNVDDSPILAMSDDNENGNEIEPALFIPGHEQNDDFVLSI
ncbi:hypothetical protein IAT40_002933 [Kwoniella sp. CBS 6097]